MIVLGLSESADAFVPHRAPRVVSLRAKLMVCSCVRPRQLLWIKSSGALCSPRIASVGFSANFILDAHRFDA